MLSKNCLVFSSILILTLAACTANKPLDTLNAETISTLGNDCQEIATRQVDAWASKDPDNLREIYTDDIVHFDGDPAYIGIEEVIDMSKKMYGWFPNWGMSIGDTYISANKCFGTWWNWETMNHSKDNPAPEYDLLETQNGNISYWTVYYARDFFGPPETDDALEQAFASTWSQGKPEKIKDLYTKDAEFEDTLFGFSSKGQQKIANYASRFLMKAPDVRWELKASFQGDKSEYPYKEQYPYPSEGGVFAITVTDDTGQACDLTVLVVLTPNDEGLITKQETFYSADSLIACGWAD